MDNRIQEIEVRVAEIACCKLVSFIEFESKIWRVFELGKEAGKIECDQTINSLISEIKKLHNLE